VTANAAFQPGTKRRSEPRHRTGSRWPGVGDFRRPPAAMTTTSSAVAGTRELPAGDGGTGDKGQIPGVATGYCEREILPSNRARSVVPSSATGPGAGCRGWGIFEDLPAEMKITSSAVPHCIRCAADLVYAGAPGQSTETRLTPADITRERCCAGGHHPGEVGDGPWRDAWRRRLGISQLRKPVATLGEFGQHSSRTTDRTCQIFQQQRYSV
jgi:hypothetical protein